MDWSSDCPTSGLFDISTSGTQLTLSDDDEVGISLPFPVLFQGVLMNDVTIGANGGAVLGTQTGNVGYGGNFNTLPDGTLFPWGDDMQCSSRRSILSRTGNCTKQSIYYSMEQCF